MFPGTCFLLFLLHSYRHHIAHFVIEGTLESCVKKGYSPLFLPFSTSERNMKLKIQNAAASAVTAVKSNADDHDNSNDDNADDADADVDDVSRCGNNYKRSNERKSND